MKLQFGDKELEIKSLDLNQLVEIEEKFGSLAALEKNIPLKVIRFIAFLAIRVVCPEVTEELVGKNLDLTSMAGIPKLLAPEAQIGDARPLAQP